MFILGMILYFVATLGAAAFMFLLWHREKQESQLQIAELRRERSPEALLREIRAERQQSNERFERLLAKLYEEREQHRQQLDRLLDRALGPIPVQGQTGALLPPTDEQEAIIERMMRQAAEVE